MAVKPEDSIYQLLSTNGDGTGTTNAIGDYSSAAAEFYITPQSDKKYYIRRMLIFIEDAAATFSADNYGGINSALTNGVRCVCKDQHGTEALDLTSGLTIKSNAGWGQHCFDAVPSTYGTGNVFLNVRWTFEKSGKMVYLQRDDRLSILLNDDLSGLVTHTFIVHGYQE